ncbi:MAG: hypothetical protein J5752_07125 [Clostridiales bacterium]|nr:hypothetical protein [Clostridiales bacterium]
MNEENNAAEKAEQRHLLYLKQKELLETFLEKGAISQKQFDKSFHDLTEKMGEGKSE